MSDFDAWEWAMEHGAADRPGLVAAPDPSRPAKQPARTAIPTTPKRLTIILVGREGTP